MLTKIHSSIYSGQQNEKCGRLCLNGLSGCPVTNRVSVISHLLEFTHSIDTDHNLLKTLSLTVNLYFRRKLESKNLPLRKA